jgi:hypothetical protein
MQKWSLLVAMAAVTLTTGSAVAQSTQRSPASLECSKEADAKGLHGKQRKEFRSKCKYSFKHQGGGNQQGSWGQQGSQVQQSNQAQQGNWGQLGNWQGSRAQQGSRDQQGNWGQQGSRAQQGSWGQQGNWGQQSSQSYQGRETQGRLPSGF